MDRQLNQRIAEYPLAARQRITLISEWILKLAQDLELGEVTQSLKWGEPSFSVSSGSPIRIDWKRASPERVSVYFVCTTKLVDTFRQLYASELCFEGNRAIHLPLSEPVPEQALQHCLTLAMRYKQLKQLPLLGA